MTFLFGKYMSLTHKSQSAIFWSGADVFLRQGLQFFVSILLARLLSPEDFGVVAMLYVFISLAAVFVDSGFMAKGAIAASAAYCAGCRILPLWEPALPS